MEERVRIQRARAGGSYFAGPQSGIEFIPSGCKLLDMALGGGWAENRVINIVGDRSTGKTLLCIEASANFARKYATGKILYRESEHAFDPQYAEALGLPLEQVDFGETPLQTVEDLFEDIDRALALARRRPCLYICDSLDALSDRAEMQRDLDEGSYGTDKAKMMSQLFRRLVGKLAEVNLTLIIVSQVRDNIGASFMARKTVRSGGRALDFYASQVLFLSHLGTLTRTVSKVTRATGVKIKAKVDKNKVGLPLRDVQFNIKFLYGIDDEQACKNWLKEVGEPIPEKGLRRLVERKWREIETALLPTHKKYY